MNDELRKALREPHDEARAHRNWEAVSGRRYRTPSVPMNRPIFGVALVLGLSAAVALAMIAWPHAAGPLTREDGAELHGALPRGAMTLDEGSEITIESGARLEVLENTGDHVRLWLHEGVARFDIVPGGPRRWAIETGLVTVEVLGTAFSVSRSLESVTVQVARGSVLVRGPTAPDGMRRLGAGESITVAAGETTIARVEPVVSTSSSPSSSPSPSRSTSPSRSSSTSAASTDAPESPRLRDVDALRAAGRIDEAVALLVAISDDPAAGRERALAAFTRGRLELDRRDHPREAAAAFEQAITLGLREPLLEDARARRVEALARASDVAAAREAAEAYRRAHPEGRWAAEVDRWSPPS